MSKEAFKIGCTEFNKLIVEERIGLSVSYRRPETIKIISGKNEYIFKIASAFYYCEGNIQTSVDFEKYHEIYKDKIQFERPNDVTTTYSFSNIQLAVKKYKEKKWTPISGRFNVDLLNTKFETVGQRSK